MMRGRKAATPEHAHSPPQRVLCALFSLRYEAPYLLPWLAYHRLLGFDRIILYHDDTSGMFSADNPRSQDGCPKLSADVLLRMMTDAASGLRAASDEHERRHARGPARGGGGLHELERSDDELFGALAAAGRERHGQSEHP